MRLHPDLGKTSYLFFGCFLNAVILPTADAAQVRLDSEPTIIDKISVPAPVITAISEDTGIEGDGITSDNTIKIHGTAHSNSVVEIAINGVAVGTAVTDDTGGWLFDYTETELAVGNHTIAATAIDSYGKMTNPPATFDLVVEPPPPVETTNHSPVIKPPTASTVDLIVTFGGSGNGSVTSSPKGIACSSKGEGCRYTFEGADNIITLNPIAAADSRFTNWGGHEDCRDGEITVAEGGEKFCMAYFTQNQPLNLTLTVEKIGTGQGVITAKGIDCGKDCREVYPQSERLTLTATASADSQFEGWTGDCIGSNPSITITIAEEMNCLAQFGAVEKTETPAVIPVETIETSDEVTNPATEDNPLEEPRDPVVEPTDFTEDTRVCPPEHLLNYACNAQGQTVQDLKIVDDSSGSGNLSNAVVTGTIYNQGWVSNLVIKETGVVIGGVVSGRIENQGGLIDIEFRGERLNGGVLAGRILNTSKVEGIIENVTLAPGAHLKGGYVGGTIEGDVSELAVLENVTVANGSTLNYVLLGEGVILPAQLTLGQGVQVLACTENNVSACLTQQQCQDVGGSWHTQTATCVKKVSTHVTEEFCDATQLSACKTAETCAAVGGQWIKDACEPKSVETAPESTAVEKNEVNPPHCPIATRQAACEAIDGVYVAGQCQRLPTCNSQSLVLKPWGEKEASSATFACGLAVEKGQYTKTAHLFPAQPISIRCNVKTDPMHIGQAVNLVVFGCYEGIRTFFSPCVAEFCWMMDKRTGEVEVSLWDRKPESLVPFEQNVVLGERLIRELYVGTFQATGILNIFFGYQLDQGDIIYNLYPIDVTVHPNGWWYM
jgi:hypothetical protein